MGSPIRQALEGKREEDYTVEFIEDWRDSGQNRYSSFYLRISNIGIVIIIGGLEVIVHSLNPPTNMANRGRSVKNTLGYVNLDKDTIWNGNYISEDRANILI